MLSRWSMLVWIAAILIGSGLVASALLVFFPLHRDANESIAINAPTEPTEQKRPLAPSTVLPPKKPSSKTPPLPDDQPKSRDKSAAATANKLPAPPAAKSDEPRGGVADPPKQPGQDEQKSLVANEPTGLVADARRKPEPLGVPKEPKLGLIADSPKALYEERTKPKTAEWLGERGGTIQSQKAVEDGLNWLARHQGEDGHWGADCLGTDPNSRCDRNAPCQETGQAYEIAQTGLALLAFQAAGNYYFNGQKYSDQVKKGLEYFIQEQATDGSIVGSQNPSALHIAGVSSFNGYFMFEHFIGTFALCEACAVALAEG